ncbi:MAG TPA: hypothetical protein VFS43_40005 [Polyangiaceae bacterium]|nr:hypothetical protein [Polyangiaceae bacterium]
MTHALVDIPPDPPGPAASEANTPLWRQPITWGSLAALVMVVVIARFVLHRLRGGPKGRG